MRRALTPLLPVVLLPAVLLALGLGLSLAGCVVVLERQDAAGSTGMAPPGGAGTLADPYRIDVGPTYGATVQAFGDTYFRFTPGISGNYTVALTRVDSDLAFVLDDALPVSFAPLLTCDAQGADGDEVCATPFLSAGTPYYLDVLDRSGASDEFDLRVYR